MQVHPFGIGFGPFNGLCYCPSCSAQFISVFSLKLFELCTETKEEDV